MSTQEILKGSPRELPKNDKKIPEFDRCMLPNIIGNYVDELARVVQQPVSYIATASLVSIAGLLGNKVCLQLNEKRRVYPILWGMLVGESGTGKSPSIQETIKPIKAIDRENFKLYQEELGKYQLVSELEQSDIDNIKGNIKNYERTKTKVNASLDDLKDRYMELEQDRTIKPYSREVHLNQSTKEALIKQLSEDSPNGLLIDIDELADWLNSITRVDKADEHGLYVSAYNCDSYKSKTIYRGTQYVHNVTLSIIGGVQTQRLLEFTKNYSGSGLLARFQLIPIAEKTLRVHSEDIISSCIEANYISLVGQLRAIPERFNMADNQIVESEPTSYQYTKEAKDVYIDWYNELQRDIQKKDQSDLMIEYLGKADNTFHTIALIFHLSESKGVSHITKDTVDKVVLLMLYFYECANYLYGDDTDLKTTTAKKILNFKSRLGSEFTLRDAMRSTTALNKLGVDLVDDALTLLDEHNFIDVSKVNKKGKSVYKWL